MGDELCTARAAGAAKSQGTGIIEKILPEVAREPVKVYNFQVEDLHTYHVGLIGVWVHNSKCGGKVGSGNNTNSTNYKKVFFEKNPELEGKVVVHHSVEQQVLKRYPGLFTAEEINAYDMLRGVPKEINGKVHLSQIRRLWDNFYKIVDAGEVPLTQESFLNKAREIDKLLGS